MGFKISELPPVETPLSGDELLEVTQGSTSRRLRVMDMLPGYDSTLAANLASTAADKGTALVGGLIANNLTINVPADQPSIAAAMVWLRARTIVRGAKVTIKVADGTHTLTGAVSLNHPQGGNINLIGNQGDPTLCVLTIADSATYDGLICTAGHRFGLIDGFTITRPTKAEMPINTTAILAVQNATIICGENVRISNWFYGIAARDGSYIYCPKAKVSYAGDVGIWAFCGSTIVCNYATSDYASAADNEWGFGFQAEFGSTLVGTGISATGCKIAGIAALSNSTCRLSAATSNGNPGSGLFARDGGVIEAGGSTTTNNTRYGAEVLEGNGRIYSVGTNSGNAMGASNPYAFLTVAGGQARLASTSGPLRLDSQGQTFFNTSNGLQLSIGDTPSAANRLHLAAAAAGAPPAVQAIGNDSNINLRLTPKGTGRIQIGATTVLPADFASGHYIELLSSDGAVLRIPCQRQ